MTPFDLPAFDALCLRAIDRLTRPYESLEVTEPDDVDDVGAIPSVEMAP
jgi:hypothetical protein